MIDKVKRSAIERVAKLLIPNRVLLVRSIVDLADIPPEPDESIMVQYSRPICESFETQEIDETLYGYVFNVVTGIRFLDADRCNDEESNSDDCVVGLISAEFSILYHSQSDEPCADSDLEEFSKQNVAFHIWPYWREFNQSACIRAGVTPPPIGVFMIDKYKPSEDGEKESD